MDTRGLEGIDLDTGFPPGWKAAMDEYFHEGNSGVTDSDIPPAMRAEIDVFFANYPTKGGKHVVR
jgi:hypothetical protein